MDKTIKSLKRRIASLRYICSGTLLHRRLVCGKDRCRCKAVPPILHGPYYYWSRRHGGRLVSRVLSPAQAKIVSKAIREHRKALQLLRGWEALTVRVVEKTSA